jgi:hypothetical protein
MLIRLCLTNTYIFPRSRKLLTKPPLFTIILPRTDYTSWMTTGVCSPAYRKKSHGVASALETAVDRLKTNPLIFHVTIYFYHVTLPHQNRYRIYQLARSFFLTHNPRCISFPKGQFRNSCVRLAFSPLPETMGLKRLCCACSSSSNLISKDLPVLCIPSLGACAFSRSNI